MRQNFFLRRGCAFILLLATLQRCSGYKALFVFPFPYRSHFMTCVVLAEELARRGHEVTVVTLLPKENANYRQIIVDSKPYQRFEGVINFTTYRQMNRFMRELPVWSILNAMVDTFLQSKEVQGIINSKEHYDVILGEISFFQAVFVAFGHKFKAPVVDIFCSPPVVSVMSRMGNPHNPSYIPHPYVPVGERMTFLERVYSAAFGIWEIAGEYLCVIPAQDALMRKYFTYPGSEDLPPLRDLIKNVSLLLVSAHFSITYPRPFSPNVIEVGGYHLRPVCKLPQDLQKFMDEAKNGVVYFSFGSIFHKNELNEERIQTIAEGLKKLQQRVIIMWEDHNEFKDAENIMVVSWAPQQEILAHPSCLLFVTHGGHNSLMEAAWAGVPVVCIPLFGNHFRSTPYAEYYGIGKGLELEDFTSDELHDTITAIIKTPSFRENAKEISRRTQDRPQSPLDTAIFWIDYVVRHKGAHHLKPAAVYLPYYQYLLLDVLGALFLVIFTAYKLVSIFCCAVCKSTASKIESISKKNK